MVKRVYSLKGRKIFKEVYQKGKKFYGKGILLFAYRPTVPEEYDSGKKEGLSLQNTKIGITINKRFGKAPARNRAKRQIRAVCSEFISEMSEGYCIIIRPGERFKELSFNRAREEIKNLFEKAGVMEK